MQDSLFQSKRRTEDAPAPSREPIDAAVLLEPGQAPFAQRLLEVGHINATWVCWAGAIPPEAPPALSGAKPVNDPRQLFTQTDAPHAIVLHHGPENDRPLTEDQPLLQAASERGLTVHTLPPTPLHLTDLQAATKHAEHTHAFPRLSADPAFPDLLEYLEQVGEPRGVTITLGAPHGTLPLLAMLTDACEAAHRLLGTPFAASAAIVPDTPVASLDRPHSLDGTCHVFLRHPGGRVCTVVVRARGPFTRSIEISTADGIARFDHGALSAAGNDGSTQGSGDTPDARTPAEVCAEQIRRRVDPGVVRPDPIDQRVTIATLEACLLSARTAAPESPETMLQMSGERAGG